MLTKSHLKYLQVSFVILLCFFCIGQKKAPFDTALPKNVNTLGQSKTPGYQPAKKKIQKLTDQDKRLLASARDYTSQLDEAAWYPLLDNVSQWPFGTYPHGVGFNLEILLAEPDEQRGRLFVVRGQFPRGFKKVDGKLEIDNDFAPIDWSRFNRGGPWEGRTQRWDVITNTQEQDPDKHIMASLIVLNPLPITSGDTVDFVGYFYKIARQNDQAGRPTDYPVFVGQVRGIEKAGYVQGSKRLQETVGPSTMLLPLFAVGLIIGFIYFRYKYKKPERVTAVSRLRRERREVQGDTDPNEIEEEILPEDPVAALQTLESRQQELQTTIEASEETVAQATDKLDQAD